ncbi:MAG: tetrahydrofolate dehydrogenase/cyclohydrolase catalytic domain-containing protein, partial [Geobacteraceae bacterium]|nr:tetrahydrofolate dehydrogenase/cyclohydrolase catalytic domain-containing protein [Geobacteraceae bacterium]
MAIILDGKATARKIRSEISTEVGQLVAEGIQPGLAVILVGDNPASRVYVRMKEKACCDVGIFSDEYTLPADTEEKKLLSLIDKLNSDSRIHGILVQLPLPKHINEAKVLEAISPGKDVDGFHPYNVGRLVLGKPVFQPCTPYGIMVLMKEYGIDLTGKEV